MQSIGNQIRALRIKKKMTLSELAKKSNLAISTLCDIKKGRSNPSIGSLNRIAVALGVSSAFLMSSDYVNNVIHEPTGTDGS